MGKTLRLGWPNRITIGRILLIGPFVVCLLNQDQPGYGWLRWAAISIFALMAVSDMLDGFLARRLHDESDLGKFLDPLADKVLITTAVLILCIHGVHSPMQETPMHLPDWVAVAAVGKDLVVSIGFAVTYLVTGKPFIQPRLPGKWCTTVQLALVLAMLLWLDLPVWLWKLPEILWWAATILAVCATLDYLRIGSRQLARSAAEKSQEDPGD
ncbi:MAG: CDP-alcohol phosphatidyltransferase family protein [Phycisphaerales bacterium]|nr:CDP-alcohol phosphatidyltransferase family protein [Phycisphaerales bacterium]